MIGMPILHTRAQNILPKWFGGPDAPRISSKMIDPIFYNVRRRPNQTLLVIVGILMVSATTIILRSYRYRPVCSRRLALPSKLLVTKGLFAKMLL